MAKTVLVAFLLTLSCSFSAGSVPEEDPSSESSGVFYAGCQLPMTAAWASPPTVDLFYDFPVNHGTIGGDLSCPGTYYPSEPHQWQITNNAPPPKRGDGVANKCHWVGNGYFQQSRCQWNRSFVCNYGSGANASWLQYDMALWAKDPLWLNVSWVVDVTGPTFGTCFRSFWADIQGTPSSNPPLPAPACSVGVASMATTQGKCVVVRPSNAIPGCPFRIGSTHDNARATGTECMAFWAHGETIWLSDASAAQITSDTCSCAL